MNILERRSTMGRRHLDVEDRSVVIKLLKQGQSPELVAAAFDVSFWTVRSIAERAQRSGQGRGMRLDQAR